MQAPAPLDDLLRTHLDLARLHLLSPEPPSEEDEPPDAAEEPDAPEEPVEPPEPPRKSVTYQPEPLSWKPAAVSCLLKASAPQAGQVERGASEIFCRTSLAWPQDPHL